MKISHEFLLGAAAVALLALLGQQFIFNNHQVARTNPDSETSVDTAAESEASSPETSTEIFAQMQDRYGEQHAVHEMNAGDLEKGSRVHLGVYLVKGDVKKELGVTSLGPESYDSKSHLAVAIADGKTMIERWGDDGYTGQSWQLGDQAQQEILSLRCSADRPVITIKEEGDTQIVGSTGNGWDVMIEFWQFTPTGKSA